jgi:hypothetical protein
MTANGKHVKFVRPEKKIPLNTSNTNTSKTKTLNTVI